MDAANIDLKAFTERFYNQLCGGHLAPVLDTLKYLKQETDVWFEITTLLIPEENDSDNELHELCEWVLENLGQEVPIHFTAFHPDWKLTDKPPTPASTLTRARKIALATGLAHAYTGNVYDVSGGSTYCSGCGAELIRRNWYEIENYDLDKEGRCPKCLQPLAGKFAAGPGSWGARRLPVRLADFR